MTNKNKKKDPIIKALLKLSIKITTLCIIIICLFTFVFGIFRIKDASMSPNINAGDLALFYRINSKYIISDVVVFTYKGQTKLARIVALPNDTIAIDEKGIKVNNSGLYEPKIFKDTLPFTEGIKFPITLKNDEYFALIDNRDKGEDSRLFGPIKKSEIKGKIISILRRRNI